MSYDNDILDLVVVGAGPVGLLAAIVANRLGLRVAVIDQKSGPIEFGRADALNARSQQLLEVLDLVKPLWKLGKPCNTSTTIVHGQVQRRCSSWWDSLEGCYRKSFLMLGQPHIERHFNETLLAEGVQVHWNTTATEIRVRKPDDGNNGSEEDLCQSCVVVEAETQMEPRLDHDESHDGTLTDENGKPAQSIHRQFRAKFLIGADGGRSTVRKQMDIPFNVTSPQLVWAVLDVEIATTYPKAPEIVVFQQDTADVAWIPREDPLDRFYVRMDRTDFTHDEVVEILKGAFEPYQFDITKVHWSSYFSVREGVADRYIAGNCVFLAGDAAHTHAVNGGQGLNTGLADAMNLIWKLNLFMKRGKDQCPGILASYEQERRPVAVSVVESSGALVRSTKYRADMTKTNHVDEYLSLVDKYSGNVTGMGIRTSVMNGPQHPAGQRLYDFPIVSANIQESTQRFYSMCGFNGKFHLLLFDRELDDELQDRDANPLKGIVNIWRFSSISDSPKVPTICMSKNPCCFPVDRESTVNGLLKVPTYGNMILVRPDMYILEQSSFVRDIFEALSTLTR